MTTTTSPLSRAYSWLLDLDGDLYGDEQERLRWYEGTTVAATVQSIAVPWAIAGALWAGGEKVATALLIVALAFYLPMFVASDYVRRHKVRLTRALLRPKNLLLTALALIPYFAIAFALVRIFLGQSGLKGSFFGAAVGGSVAAALLIIRARRRRAWENSDEESN